MLLSCRCAECCFIIIVMLNAVMLSVIMLIVILLSVVMQNVIMPSVIMLNVIKLSVEGPIFKGQYMLLILADYNYFNDMKTHQNWCRLWNRSAKSDSEIARVNEP